jgi:hypothetical protein
MGWIEIAVTAFLIYAISLATYLLWHRLLWGSFQPSLPLLKYFYYGQNPSSCEGTDGRRREEHPD